MPASFPSDPGLPPLSVEELERLRDDVRRSMDHTRAELDLIEARLLAARLRSDSAASTPPLPFDVPPGGARARQAEA